MKLGPVEAGVWRDLQEFPENIRMGGIAMAARTCAREIDLGVSTRDLATMAREIRMSLVQLRELAPGEVVGDTTDQLRAKRENRMRERGYQ